MSYIIVSHHNLDVYHMTTQPLLKLVTNNRECICKTVDCSFSPLFYISIHPFIPPYIIDPTNISTICKLIYTAFTPFTSITTTS